MMIMTLIVLVGFLLWYDNVMRTIKSYLCSIDITNVTHLHSENEMVKSMNEAVLSSGIWKLSFDMDGVNNVLAALVSS